MSGDLFLLYGSGPVIAATLWFVLGSAAFVLAPRVITLGTVYLCDLAHRHRRKPEEGS